MYQFVTRKIIFTMFINSDSDGLPFVEQGFCKHCGWYYSLRGKLLNIAENAENQFIFLALRIHAQVIAGFWPPIARRLTNIDLNSVH